MGCTLALALRPALCSVHTALGLQWGGPALCTRPSTDITGLVWSVQGPQWVQQALCRTYRAGGVRGAK